MKFNISLVISLLLAGVCLVLNRPFLEATESKNHKKAFWYKLFASACFMLIGVLPLITVDSGFSEKWCVIFIGLFFGVLGDLLLSFRHLVTKMYYPFFILGAAAFSVEHIVFVSRFVYENSDVVPVAALCFVIFFAIVSFLFAKFKVDGGRLKFGIYAYIALVVLMFSFAAATCFSEKSISAVMFALGALSFTASDTTICIYNFSPFKDFKLMVFLHYTYAPAQILIALSLLFA